MKYISSRSFQPAKIIFLSYAGLIIIGAILLKIPLATTAGISFFDAIFTSTSAICVTGLIVKNTAADFTVFGQSIILFLIQIGGIGYMLMAFFMIVLMGRKMTISESLLMKDMFNLSSLDNIYRFVKKMLALIIAIELIGTVLLFISFSGDGSVSETLFLSLFHSVSAFNNAGFSLFNDSLNSFKGNFLLNMTVMFLIIAGGTGFLVFTDLGNYYRRRVKRLLIHTKLVISISIILTLAGAILFYLMERNFLFADGFSLQDTLLTSLFGSVTARTAGFNTVSYNLLQSSTLFMTMILMLIGASPGGTGGGVKTTTLAVIFLYIRSSIKGHTDTYVFQRRIAGSIIAKSFLIVFLAVTLIIVVTLIIIDVEHSDLSATLFEVVSAMGTVGLSVGNGGDLSLSASFSDFSRLLIILVMFVGRLGPFTFFISVFNKENNKIRYPEGRLMIG